VPAKSTRAASKRKEKATINESEKVSVEPLTPDEDEGVPLAKKPRLGSEEV
jgi:hypothetical protein